MEFRLLGPIEAYRAGKPVPLGGPRQRALLAALLLRANSVATSDYLTSAIWENPPVAPVANIRTYVAQLRRRFGVSEVSEIRLATSPGGYVLSVPSAKLDLLIFYDLAGRGRDALQQRDFEVAVEHLGSALGLWRGEPLTGESLTTVVAARVASLTDLRLTVVEQYANACIELGQPQVVVDDLRQLVGEHPLREELWAQLMLALYRCNRQGEALDAFAKVRHHLVEDLGIEPSQRLRQLQSEILSGIIVPALAPQTTEPDEIVASRQLPMDITEFTGREAELRRLHTLIDRTTPDAPTAVVISAIEGMAGVGKTRLAIRVAHQLVSQGRYDQVQLWTDLRGFDTDHSPTDPASVLEGFLRSLGVPGQQIPQGVERRAALYRDRLAGKQALILLDNAAREEQIRPLLPGSPGSLVLITSRRRLSSLDGADVLPLGVLPHADAIAMLVRISNDDRIAAEPEAATRVADLCGGLPIALSLAARLLQARPTWTVGDLAERLARDLDGPGSNSPQMHGLHALFDLSYRAIPAEQQRMFRLLGLHVSNDFTAESAAALSGTTPQQAEVILEALLDEHLLQQVVAGRYQFHDLIRPYARHQAHTEESPAQREEAVHQLLTWYLHAAESVRQVLDPQRVRIIALPPVPPRSMVPTVHDYESALAWFETERANLVAAVEAAIEHRLFTVGWQLPWVLLSFFYRRSYWDDWIHTYHSALDASRSLGDARAQGIIWRGLGVAYSDRREFATAIDCHGRAQVLLEQTDDRHGQAWNLNNLGVVYVSLEQLPEAAACFQQALPMFRDTDDLQGVGICLNNLSDIDRQLGRFSEAFAHLNEALTVQREMNDVAAMQFTLNSLGDVHRDNGQYDDAVRHYQEALAISQRLGDRRTVARTLANLALAYDATNRTSAAVDHWQRALTIFDALNDTQAEEIRIRLAGR